MSSKRSRIHDQELRRLLSFIGIFGLFSGATYVVPGLDLVRPWVPGEPVPLVHLALDRAIVTENRLGEIVRQMPGEDARKDAPVTVDSGSPPPPGDGSDQPPPAVDTPADDTPRASDLLADQEASPPADADVECEPDAVEQPAEVVVADADLEQPEVEATDPEDTPHPGADDPAPEPEEPVDTEADAGTAAPPAEVADATPAVLAPPAPPPDTKASVAVAIPQKAPPERAATPDNVARPGEGSLRSRLPAHGTPLEVPTGGLDAWFTSLAKAAAGAPGHIARALHWGDSTIAGDGITRTVRSRLQSRFGDGGPGFLAVQVDPRWASRPGVLRNAKGAWKTRTITFGGAGNKYYGLGGTVSTAYGKSSSTLGGSKVGDQRQALHRFDIAFQTRPDGGTLVVQVDGGEGATFQTKSESTSDAFHTLTAPNGAQKLHVASNGDGPVTVYGVALETRGPGMTWETLGVAGAGQGSMFRQGPNHLARQVAWRDPDLIVYQMGGNELGYPSLKTGGGKVWKERYVRVVRSVRKGAPDASCLLITPLDQGERVRGAVRSKPTMATMVRLQRETAREMGCAFWDAQAAMGGSGSFGVWLNKKLAWSDLYHLTNKGLAIIGHTLSDAMEAAYDEWRRGTAASLGRSSGPSDG